MTTGRINQVALFVGEICTRTKSIQAKKGTTTPVSSNTNRPSPVRHNTKQCLTILKVNPYQQTPSPAKHNTKQCLTILKESVPFYPNNATLSSTNLGNTASYPFRVCNSGSLLYQTRDATACFYILYQQRAIAFVLRREIHPRL